MEDPHVKNCKSGLFHIYYTCLELKCIDANRIMFQ